MTGHALGVATVVTMPFIVVTFALGYWWGRRVTVQRHVDAVLRRETRLRHPSAAAERPMISLPGVTTADALKGAEAFSAAVRQAAAGVERLCGKPVHNPAVGDWPCVDVAGHDGPCR